MLKKISALVLSLFLLAALEYFSPPWFFCLLPLSMVENDHFIKIALLEENKKGNLVLNGSDNAVEQYIKDHPQCCTVEPIQSKNKALLPFGNPGVIVHAIYKMRRPPSKEYEGWYYESFVYITSCGKVFQKFGQMIDPEHVTIP